MSGQSYDIEVERDDVGITRRVWLTLDPDGSLSLAGHDMGRAVTEFWGEGFDEYEWSWTLQQSQIPALLTALQVDTRSAEAIHELATKVRALGVPEAQKQFGHAGRRVLEPGRRLTAMPRVRLATVWLSVARIGFGCGIWTKPEPRRTDR